MKLLERIILFVSISGIGILVLLSIHSLFKPMPINKIDDSSMHISTQSTPRRNYIEELVNDSLEYSKYTAQLFINRVSNRDNTEILRAISDLEYYTNVPGEFVEKSLRAKKIIQHIKNKCNTIKNAVMPTFRKRFAENLDRAMWEYNMDVSASSSRFKWLNLTGYMFADNAAKKQYYELLKYQAKDLGFTRICFRWYDGQDDYTYFNLD